LAKGWNTTDEDEIEVRKKRALKGEFVIKNLQRKNRVFADYELYSGKSRYLVELRSLKEYINSCSCPDFSVNRLGTCKHIEAVKLLYKDKKTKNNFIEIFVDSIDGHIKILFPKKSDKLYTKLNQYFSANGSLIGDPLVGFEVLKREIERLSDKERKKIRVSAFIEEFLQKRRFEKEKIENKRVFLQDYKDGKRSFEFLKFPLFDYQKEGVLHLAFNERALLADEMGLGKTIQAIGASVLLKNLRGIKRVLVVSPASLKSEWGEQIEKFTDLTSLFIAGNKKKREKLYKQNSFFYLCNYEQILYDYEEINSLLSPDIIILDEAQRIKNWQTKTANSIKKLQSRYAFVLTGTPLENRIDEIYSIVQFLDPTLFGPLFRFNREFYKLDANGIAIGYKNINLLHKKLEPIMLRRRKADIENELPKRIDKSYFVRIDPKADEQYGEYESIVSRLAAKSKKMPLSPEEMKRLQIALSCMRMLCDALYILDQRYENSPKIDEAISVIEELLEQDGVKIIIFSEWERMLELLYKRLEKSGVDVAWHTGSLSQIKRKEEINRFKGDKSCKIFLSTDSGSVGLNLQVANVVINLDIPWNPAKLEQRIARAWRKHQKNQVTVINFVTEDRIEQKIVEVVKQKQYLSDNVLDGLGEDELALPSGRKEFMKDLEKVLFEDQNKKDEKDPEFFAQEIATKLNDRVKNINYNSKTDTVFVVVDKKDDSVGDKIAKTKEKNIPSKKITILDNKELELLEKLANEGLIEIKDDIKTLFKKEQKEQNLDEESIIKIKGIYDKLKRKYELANFLLSGSFKEESLVAFDEFLTLMENSLQSLKEYGLEICDVDECKNQGDDVAKIAKKCFGRLKQTVGHVLNNYDRKKY